MISTQLEKQMEKMNVRMDKIVSNAPNAGHNQQYSTPTDDLPTLTPENQLIANQITPQKPLGTIREKNPGNSLLTAQQKLDNLPKQIEDGTIYSKAIEKNKRMR